jgi:hypothetical protein
MMAKVCVSGGLHTLLTVYQPMLPTDLNFLIGANDRLMSLARQALTTESWYSTTEFVDLQVHRL